MTEVWEQGSPCCRLCVSTVVRNGMARHVPCSTSAKGWWVIDALRCIQKYSVSFQLNHFRGLRCRVCICRLCLQQLFSWKDIWLSSKITEMGGICPESPECKKHLAPTFQLSLICRLSAEGGTIYVQAGS